MRHGQIRGVTNAEHALQPRTATQPADRYADHVTVVMTATEVKARILALLDDVAAGEQVEITKHGRLVARLVPARGPHALRGVATAMARSAAADEDLYGTEETWDAG